MRRTCSAGHSVEFSGAADPAALIPIIRPESTTQLVVKQRRQLNFAERIDKQFIKFVYDWLMVILSRLAAAPFMTRPGGGGGGGAATRGAPRACAGAAAGPPPASVAHGSWPGGPPE